MNEFCRDIAYSWSTQCFGVENADPAYETYEALPSIIHGIFLVAENNS